MKYLFILIAGLLIVGCNAKPSLLISNHTDTVFIHDTTLLNSFTMHNEILQNTFHEGFNQGAISAMKLVNQNRYSYKNIMKEYRQDSINFYNAIVKPLQ